MIKNSNRLSGAKPSCDIALLLVDVINDLEFPGNEQLVSQMSDMPQRLKALKAAAKEADIPVIYVNDNFRQWRSNLNEILEHCLKDGVKGRELAEQLRPDKDDYFVLKPKHSGFYCTPLDILLTELGVEQLIITGLAGNICVLYTANDAYMHGYKIIVPPDCVASNTAEDNKYALTHMQNLLKAQLKSSYELIQQLQSRNSVCSAPVPELRMF